MTFIQGHIPWNKGKNVRLNPKGEFKKGQKPVNTGSRKQRVKCVCKVCGKKFEEFVSGIKEGRGKFCSRSCWINNHNAWNKGIKGLFTEEKSAHWKGDKVGYGGVHMWIRKNYGKPEKCEKCGVTKNDKIIQWANISQLYKRDINDYMQLCVSCHKKYDRQFLNGG